MANFIQQKEDILALIQEAILFSRSRNFQTTINDLQEVRDKLAEKKLYVVVCGEFKKGKSSLLNALLNEKDLFPVNVKVATNLVSTITYGAQEKITVIFGDKGKEKTKVISRAEIPEYVTEQGNEGNYKDARMLLIETPNPRLQEGLVLVDTPGMGSLNAEHSAITYAFIPNADAVIYVSDVQAPLTTYETDFIKKISKHCSNFLFTVTKIDQSDNYDTILDNNHEKLVDVLSQPKEEIKIVPVSSSAKMRYLQTGNARDLKNSNFETLERELWNLLTAKGADILLSPALSSTGRILAELKGRLQADWQACQKDSVEETKKMEEKLKEATQKRQRLLENNAEWQEQLVDEIRQLRLDFNYAVEEAFGQVKQEFMANLTNSDDAANVDEIVKQVESSISNAMVDIIKQLSISAANVQGRMESITNLGFNPFEVEQYLDPDKYKATYDKKIELAQKYEKLMSIGRQGMYTAGAGGILGGMFGAAAGAAVGFLFGGVGAVPGAQIGATLGTAVGTMAGKLFGVKEGFQVIKEKDKTTIKQHLNPFIDNWAKKFASALSETIVSLEKTMRTDLRAKIKREKEKYEDILDTIRETSKLSKETALKKGEELKVAVQDVNRLMGTFNNQLSQKVFWGGSSPFLGDQAAVTSERIKPKGQPNLAGLDD